MWLHAFHRFLDPCIFGFPLHDNCVNLDLLP